MFDHPPCQAPMQALWTDSNHTLTSRAWAGLGALDLTGRNQSMARELGARSPQRSHHAGGRPVPVTSCPALPQLPAQPPVPAGLSPIGPPRSSLPPDPAPFYSAPQGPQGSCHAALGALFSPWPPPQPQPCPPRLRPCSHHTGGHVLLGAVLRHSRPARLCRGSAHWLALPSPLPTHSYWSPNNSVLALPS